MNIISNNFKDLKKLSKDLKEIYINAEPFPHIVLDEFFNEHFLLKALEDFPDLSKDKSSSKYNSSTEIKFASKRGDTQQPLSVKQIMNFLNSHTFLDFLQDLTSIEEPLITDPHFIGGGLHEIKRGGLLKVHADFCKHSETKLDRRLNLLIYLNKNWEKSYGGELQLWDKKVKNCVKKILPIYNRIVIFNTTDFTFHGHPEKLNCPSEISRKSLALYYYSNGRPASEIRPSISNQITIFVKRPEEKFAGNNLKRYIIDILPPIITRLIKNMKSKNS